jgi:hypothetical protein
LAENSLNQHIPSSSYSSSQTSLDLLRYDISQHHSSIPADVYAVQPINWMQSDLPIMPDSENSQSYPTNQHRHEGYNRSETGNDSLQQANNMNQVFRSNFCVPAEKIFTLVPQDEPSPGLQNEAEKQQERPLAGKKRKQQRSDANTESHFDIPSTSGNTNFRNSRRRKINLVSKVQESRAQMVLELDARSVGNKNSEMRSGSDPVSDGSGGSEVSCATTPSTSAELSPKKYRRREKNKASLIN